MKTINKKYFINAPVEKVWDALVNPRTIDAWGGGPAVMSEEGEAEFKLWGGDIFGKNLEVIKNAKIVQQWQEKEWEKPSKVTFALLGKDGKTELSLFHENVPDKEFDSINSGWDEYYLEPLKNLVE